jgi:hypothetical protein
MPLPSGTALLLALAALFLCDVGPVRRWPPRGTAALLAALAAASLWSWTAPSAGPSVEVNGSVWVALPAAAVLLARLSAPARLRVLAAGAAASAMLFSLAPWNPPGPAAGVGVVGVLTGAAAALVARGPTAAAAGIALAVPAAGLAEWLAAAAGALPGTVQVGGGSTFDAACLALVVALLPCARPFLPSGGSGCRPAGPPAVRRPERCR